MNSVTLRNAVEEIATGGALDCVAGLAITFPQLIVQGRRLGLDDADLQLLQCRYLLAERMADGVYRAQGTPFINHLVRTSSIALACGQPLEVVVAAMFHGMYLMNRFEGSRRREPGAAERAFLQREIGAETEALVWCYTNLGWDRRECIELHGQRVASYGTVERSALVIALANELEDHLDLGMLYRAGIAHRERIEDCGAITADLADTLGLPGLRDALRAVYVETLANALPAALALEHANAYELPRARFWADSSLRRFIARLRRAWRRARQRVLH